LILPDKNAPRALRVIPLALMTVMVLVPVTMPVTVLRGLVQERFGVSELLTSLFMSINMVGALLTAPLAGALSDWMRCRKPLIVAALIADGALLFALTLTDSFPLFMLIRFIEGATHIFALSLLLALAADSFPEKRGRVMGLMGGGIMLGVALGAPLGGVLGRTDPLAPLLVGAIISLVAATLGALTLTESPGRNARISLREIVDAVRSNKFLLVPLAFAFIDRFTVGFFTTTFSLYLKRIHDLAPAHIGLLLASFLLPCAFLSYPCGRLCESRSPVAMLCGGSLIYGIGTATLGWWPSGWLPLLMLGLGVASAVMFVPSLLLATEMAMPGTRATILGGFNAAGCLGFIIGPITGGLVSQIVAADRGWLEGYRCAFLVAGSSEILCVLIALPFLIRLIGSNRAR